MTAEHHQMIADCEARESKLSEWERNFIDSLNQWLGADRSLTTKQMETLDNIWERVTAHG